MSDVINRSTELKGRYGDLSSRPLIILIRASIALHNENPAGSFSPVGLPWDRKFGSKNDGLRSKLRPTSADNRCIVSTEVVATLLTNAWTYYIATDALLCVRAYHILYCSLNFSRNWWNLCFLGYVVIFISKVLLKAMPLTDLSIIPERVTGLYKCRIFFIFCRNF